MEGEGVVISNELKRMCKLLCRRLAFASRVKK
jgi:hypothetical protein